jgi:hypothetical protein
VLYAPVRAGEGDQVQPAELAGELPPGGTGLALGDADQQQQRQPAQQHVAADAMFQPVVDGAQVQGGLQVPEGAFGLQQVLVAERNVFGRQVGVGGGQQVLAVEPGLCGEFGAVQHQPATRSLADPAAQLPETGRRAVLVAGASFSHHAQVVILQVRASAGSAGSGR